MSEPAVLTTRSATSSSVQVARVAQVVLPPLVFGALFFGAWELLVAVFDIQPYFLVPPSEILDRFVGNADLIWSAMRVSSSREGGVPPVVGNTAILRGRLMELLAAEMLPKDECDNAFVTGVFSLLDTMLGVPMDKAIAAITLPQSVTDALLHNKGPLAPLLELTIACEQADDENFARLANALTLSNHQVNWAHLQALAWAETMGV